MNYINKFFSKQLEKATPLTFLELQNLKSKKDIFGNEIIINDILLFCMVDTGKEYELVSIIKRLFNEDSIERFNQTFNFIDRGNFIPLFKTKIIKIEYRKYLEVDNGK